MGKARLATWLFIAVVPVAACSGSVNGNGDQNPPDQNQGGDSGGSGNGGSGGDTPNGGTAGTAAACTSLPKRAPLRRLTTGQYLNALAELAQDSSLTTLAVPVEKKVGIETYLNDADGQAPDPELTAAIEAGAEKAAKSIVARKDALLKCAATDAACGPSFIQSFGRRAFRRTLTADESKTFVDFFNTKKAAADFDTALALTIYAILQSPQFVYVPELGTGSPGADGSVPLAPTELATRLSLFLADRVPTLDLIDSAEKGGLDTPEKVAAVANQLVGSGPGENAWANFFSQWAEVEKLDRTDVAKDKTTFPMWSPEFKKALRDEVAAFAKETIYRGGGDLNSLFTTTDYWVNATTAPIYGVQSNSATMEKVKVDPSQRAGVFTLASTLAARGHSKLTSPVWRGNFVLDRILCSPVGSPPNDVPPLPAATPAATTTRQLQEGHSKIAPKCFSCHQFIDPIGFTFESYDSIGKYRTEENGVAIDSSGAVKGSDDQDGPVKNAVELAAKIAKSDKVYSCFATQVFRQAFAHLDNVNPENGAPTTDDECTIARYASALHEVKGDVRKFLVKVATSDAFVRRPALGN